MSRMAPEVIACETVKDDPYDLRADIWSFGKQTIMVRTEIWKDDQKRYRAQYCILMQNLRHMTDFDQATPTDYDFVVWLQLQPCTLG